MRSYYSFAEIKGCTFRNMKNRVLEVSGATSLQDSLIEDNICQSSCVYFQVWQSYAGWETRNVTGNTFLRNKGNYIVEYYNIYGTTAQFSNNTLFDNQVNTLPLQTPLIFNGRLSGKYNRFNNPATVYDVRTQTAVGQPNIEFTHCWWGSSDEAYVKQVKINTIRYKQALINSYQRIYDYLDDGTLTQFNYLPYLLDPNNPNNISAPVTQIPFIKPDGTVGGEMASDITMTIGGSPYNVTSTIVIPQVRFNVLHNI
jgi:hypothetical protein